MTVSGLRSQFNIYYLLCWFWCRPVFEFVFFSVCHNGGMPLWISRGFRKPCHSWTGYCNLFFTSEDGGECILNIHNCLYSFGEFNFLSVSQFQLVAGNSLEFSAEKLQLHLENASSHLSDCPGGVCEAIDIPPSTDDPDDEMGPGGSIASQTHPWGGERFSTEDGKKVETQPRTHREADSHNCTARYFIRDKTWAVPYELVHGKPKIQSMIISLLCCGES